MPKVGFVLLFVVLLHVVDFGFSYQWSQDGLSEEDRVKVENKRVHCADAFKPFALESQVEYSTPEELEKKFDGNETDDILKILEARYKVCLILNLWDKRQYLDSTFQTGKNQPTSNESK